MVSDWNKMINWELVLPPSRPTVAELSRIENRVKQFDKRVPVAILGSTPEFRELLEACGFEAIYVFDKSKEFFDLTKGMIPSVKHERLILGNWLDTLKQYPDMFQFVLSDLTMGNIEYIDRSEFYTAIYNALLSSGIFIDKALVFDFKIPYLVELFAKYEKLPINLRTINDFSSEVLFCSELVQQEYVVDTTKFYEHIKNGDFSEKIKLFAEKARIITPLNFIWYYGKAWTKLKSEYYGDYKRIISYCEEDSYSPYYKRTKQFFCEK